MVTEAIAYAEKNMPAADYDGNAVLVPADVVAGNWDPATRTFTPDPLAPPLKFNAVMTTTRRKEACGNAVQAFLGGIAGIDGYDIATSAIAPYGVGEDILTGGCSMAEIGRATCRERVCR